MIPYDDLVIALATWRARQGLPVAQLSGSLTPPPPVAPPPKPMARPMMPPPLAPPPDTHDSPLDVDDSALLEEAPYEGEGDFMMSFGRPPSDGEATAVGSMPTRDSFGAGGTDPDPDRGRGGW